MFKKMVIGTAAIMLLGMGCRVSTPVKQDNTVSYMQKDAFDKRRTNMYNRYGQKVGYTQKDPFDSRRTNIYRIK